MLPHPPVACGRDIVGGLLGRVGVDRHLDDVEILRLGDGMRRRREARQKCRYADAKRRLSFHDNPSESAYRSTQINPAREYFTL